MNYTEAYNTFKCYKALKLHFVSDNYDYYRYNGKTPKSTYDDFIKSKERQFCERLTKKYQKKTPSFLLANLSEFPNVYIRDLLNESYDTFYKKWTTQRLSNAAYIFRSEIDKIQEIQFKDLFSCDEQRLPNLIHYYIRGEISKETVCIIMKITNCAEYFDTQMKDNLFWNYEKRKFDKYLPFVRLKPKYAKSLLDKFGTIEYK